MASPPEQTRDNSAEPVARRELARRPLFFRLTHGSTKRCPGKDECRRLHIFSSVTTSGSLTLRDVRDEDLPVLFEHWADPVSVQMAAFTSPDQMDREAFERRWSRLRADEAVIARAIVVDGEVAGTIGSWGDPGEREVTYWIGRAYWGKGIATDALKAFLAVDPSRPLHARVAHDNVGSRRVLEKCGFRVIATERGFAEARDAEIEELVLRLDGSGSVEQV